MLNPIAMSKFRSFATLALTIKIRKMGIAYTYTSLWSLVSTIQSKYHYIY